LRAVAKKGEKVRRIRVFPRRTRATPDDPDVYIGDPDLFAEADEIDISVAFSWDRARAERLIGAWAARGRVRLGGPAYGAPGGEFTPGLYLKKGYVVTSRGCPNRCWFCEAWRREGEPRELEIKEGTNVIDDNLLACSRSHVERVFAMLGGQKGRIEFSGGLEAARLEPWMASALFAFGAKMKQAFFDYDTPEDYNHLLHGRRILENAGFRFNYANYHFRCFVLCGYPTDTMEEAEIRLRRVLSIGMIPFAMLYRGPAGDRDPAWLRFIKHWSRPAYMAHERAAALGGGGDEYRARPDL
jgi:hypothetical protein